MPTFPGWKTHVAAAVAFLLALASALWPEQRDALNSLFALAVAAGLSFLRAGTQKAEDMSSAAADVADDGAELLRKVLEELKKQKQEPPKA